MNTNIRLKMVGFRYGFRFLNTVAIIAITGLSLLACSNDGEEIPDSRGVYLLMDTSGTYTQELEQARRVINFTLSELKPGDSFAVARVDTGSFSEKDIVTKATFDARPSVSNEQKRKFQANITTFLKGVKSSSHTDITGGILQAIEYLDETGAGHKTILIFSDMKEDLREGYIRDEISLNLSGYSVVALNVTKLRADNVDPRKYLGRLDGWKQRVETGGGHWKVLNDLERLESLLAI
ncbi:MAG: VWA domain-containing protein [Ectothiorhodospiraceae bacterium]|nr:VWA domain-containing protein [Ectothiorhodospiraceae bacterium]